VTGAVAPPTPPLSGLAILNQKCAACHQDGKLEPNQRFILLDLKGQLSPLTPAQSLKVLTKTYLGQMPPPVNKFGIQPIGNEEYAALVQLLTP
jgi:mono/diheme cytochrome c family protein